jgi:hypothetical protein
MDDYRWSHNFADVILCKDKENHYLDIKQEILCRQFVSNSETERPVLFFFNSTTTLFDFYNHPIMKREKNHIQTIHESTPAVECYGLI